MTVFTLVFACVFGALAIIFGAFGAHALKNKLSEERLVSFETGVRYQMYSAIILLVLGLNLEFTAFIERLAVYCLISGTILFSFSIYLLSISGILNKKFKFLGPVTPIGGLLMIIGWICLMVSFTM